MPSNDKLYLTLWRHDTKKNRHKNSSNEKKMQANTVFSSSKALRHETNRNKKIRARNVEHVSIGAFICVCVCLLSFDEFQWNQHQRFGKMQPKIIRRTLFDMWQQSNGTTEKKKWKWIENSTRKENENIDVRLVVQHSSCSHVTFTMQPISHRCNRAIDIHIWECFSDFSAY